MSIQPIIETKDLWFAYDEGTPVVRGISFKIEQGDFVAIIGQNGSAKTTLVKHFNGLLQPMKGKVFYKGEDIVGRSVGALAKEIGFVFQNPDHQIFNATIREEIAFGPQNLGLDEEEVHRRTEDALTRFGLMDLADRQPAVIGFGLRRKVSVAAVYSMQTPVLVLDEPTTGLDFKSATELMELISNLHRQGTTIILITHDMRVVAQYAPRCLVIRAGEILADDDTRSIFKQYDLLQETNITVPQITILGRQMKDHGLRDGILSVSEFCDLYDQVFLGRG